jgi:hypothetical protein
MRSLPVCRHQKLISSIVSAILDRANDRLRIHDTWPCHVTRTPMLRERHSQLIIIFDQRTCVLHVSHHHPSDPRRAQKHDRLLLAQLDHLQKTITMSYLPSSSRSQNKINDPSRTPRLQYRQGASSSSSINRLSLLSPIPIAVKRARVQFYASSQLPYLQDVFNADKTMNRPRRSGVPRLMLRPRSVDIIKGHKKRQRTTPFDSENGLKPCRLRFDEEALSSKNATS